MSHGSPGKTAPATPPGKRRTGTGCLPWEIPVSYTHLALYGEELKYDFVITDPLRDDLEWKLIKAFVDRKKPIFGICRGVQVLNAYFGGTLYQDIPDELGGEHAKGVCHPVTLKKDSILGRLFGESLEINSYHHQALKDLGKDLTAVALSLIHI